MANSAIRKVPVVSPLKHDGWCVIVYRTANGPGSRGISEIRHVFRKNVNTRCHKTPLYNRPCTRQFLQAYLCLPSYKKETLRVHRTVRGKRIAKLVTVYQIYDTEEEAKADACKQLARGRGARVKIPTCQKDTPDERVERLDAAAVRSAKVAEVKEIAEKKKESQERAVTIRKLRQQKIEAMYVERCTTGTLEKSDGSTVLPSIGEPISDALILLAETRGSTRMTLPNSAESPSDKNEVPPAMPINACPTVEDDASKFLNVLQVTETAPQLRSDVNENEVSVSLESTDDKECHRDENENREHVDKSFDVQVTETAPPSGRDANGNEISPIHVQHTCAPGNVRIIGNCLLRPRIIIANENSLPMPAKTANCSNRFSLEARDDECYSSVDVEKMHIDSSSDKQAMETVRRMETSLASRSDKEESEKNLSLSDITSSSLSSPEATVKGSIRFKNTSRGPFIGASSGNVFETSTPKRKVRVVSIHRGLSAAKKRRTIDESAELVTTERSEESRKVSKQSTTVRSKSSKEVIGVTSRTTKGKKDDAVLSTDIQLQRLARNIKKMRKEMMHAISGIAGGRDSACLDSNGNIDNNNDTEPLPVNADSEGMVEIVEGVRISYEHYLRLVDVYTMPKRVNKLIEALWPDEEMQSRLCLDSKRFADCRAIVITSSDVNRIIQCCDRLQKKEKLMWTPKGRSPINKVKIVRELITRYLKNTRYRKRRLSASSNGDHSRADKSAGDDDHNNAVLTNTATSSKKGRSQLYPLPKLLKLIEQAKYTFKELEQETKISVKQLREILTADCCVEDAQGRVMYLNASAELNALDEILNAADAADVPKDNITVKKIQSVAQQKCSAEIVAYIVRKYTIAVGRSVSWNTVKIPYAKFDLLAVNMPENGSYGEFLSKLTVTPYCDDVMWEEMVELRDIRFDEDGRCIKGTRKRLLSQNVPEDMITQNYERLCKTYHAEA